MAQRIDTQAIAGGNQLFGLDAVTDRIWRFLTSMRFALALILILAALALVGSLLAQMPAGVAADPAARSSWLTQVRPKYGGWTGPFDQLQLFTIFNSIWFRVVVTLLAVSVVACSVHRMPGVWRTATKPRVDLDGTFFSAAPQHASADLPHDTSVALAAVIAVLRRHRYRTIVHDDGTVHLYADRNRWAPVGSLAGHLSLVVIMAGAIIGSTFGYRDGQFMIAEGTSAAVPTGSGLTMRLDGFRDSYYAETGAPSDFASDLVLYQGGTEVARQTVRVNQPLRYQDISFYQSFYGPAAMLTVSNASGTQLLSEGVPLAWDAPDGQRRMGSLSLPDQGLTAWVIGTTGPDDPVVKPGQVHLEIYSDTSSESAAPIAVDTITQGQPKTVGGLVFLFNRETQFTGLSVVKDPGAPLVWLGGTMLVVGVVAVLMFPHRRMWGRLVARPGGGSSLALASVGRHDTAFEAEFSRLMDEVAQTAAVPQRE